MTTNRTAELRIHPIPADVLKDVRATGFDVSGFPVVRLIAAGGEPLRCCLRDALAGEENLLFGYEPPIPAKSPYREVGAVYAHARECGGPESTVDYPRAWLGRPQVLRAYDRRGWIHDAKVHDGQDPQAVLAQMLADPDVVQIHSRNIAWGCYMFAISRPVG